MTPAATLRAAAQLIRERGWGQGYHRDAAGCFCALGAIRAACGIVDPPGDNDGPSAPPGASDADVIDEVVAAMRFVAKAAGARMLARWNDAPDRTVDDVLAAFDRAATLAEGAGS